MAAETRSEPSSPDRHEPVPRRALSVPFYEEDDIIWAISAEECHASLGVAFALSVLLRDFVEPEPVPVPVPMTLNERRTPLCREDSPLVSFIYTEPHDDLPTPSISVTCEFVQVLVSRLGMQTAEVVFAYVLVETLVRRAPQAIKTFSVRPVFLTACMVAIKVARDDIVTTRHVFANIEDVFTGLTLRGLIQKEFELMRLLDFRLPNGSIYQRYADAIFAAANMLAGGPPARKPRMLVSICCSDTEAHQASSATTIHARALALRRMMAARVAAAGRIQALMRGVAARRSDS